MTNKPRLLDLFCGAGGAAMGYHRAGFVVVGVDIKPQLHYPFEFHQGDALEFLALESLAGPAGFFDAFHASPPCQRYSQSVKKVNRGNHPDLVAATRDALIATGKPYVIENVPRAPLLNPVQLCGSNFGLKVQRHRLFESNVCMLVPPCNHTINEPQYPPAWNRTGLLRVLSISGGYQAAKNIGPEFMEMHKAAMGIDWDISYDELSNAIPPAYTEFIGRNILAAMAGGD
jgi:DNA (cytosine-5)-methyltransferase 1